MIGIFGLVARDRDLGLPVRHPRGRDRRRPAGAAAALLRRAARRLRPERRLRTSNPPCTLARHDPRALNICLLAERVRWCWRSSSPGSSDCEHQVDALQRCRAAFRPARCSSPRSRSTPVTPRPRGWSAHTTGRSRSPTTATARSAPLYGVEVCPMVELAYRGGIVQDRLIGDHWQTSRGARAPRSGAGRAAAPRGECDEVELSGRPPGSSSRSGAPSSPGCGCDWVTVAGALGGRSPRELKRRLRALSNRYRGASVVAMRTQPIPHAYRAFFRQIGLDPDVDRIPSEAGRGRAAAARRLSLRRRDRRRLPDRADRDRRAGVGARRRPRRRGGLGIRTTLAGDRLGAASARTYLAPGSLVVADAHRSTRCCSASVAPGHGVGRADRARGAVRGRRRRGAGDPRRGGAVGLRRGARRRGDPS